MLSSRGIATAAKLWPTKIIQKALWGTLEIKLAYLITQDNKFRTADAVMQLLTPALVYSAIATSDPGINKIPNNAVNMLIDKASTS
jgi:hypothetical protein